MIMKILSMKTLSTKALTMKTLKWLCCVSLLLVLAAPPPAWARVVTIQTSAPLSDHSDQAIDRALKGALDTCVRGATAMGLSFIRLDGASVLTDKVIVRMVATDEEVEDDSVKEFDVVPRS